MNQPNVDLWRTPRSKYAAIPTEIDGLRFHSAKEARRYGELKLLLVAVEIADLTLQPVFPLHVMNAKTGELIEVGRYLADFKYFDLRYGRMVVEDTKGFRTDLYRLKKRMVEAEYGVRIQET